MNYKDEIKKAILAMSKSERSDGLKEIIKQIAKDLESKEESVDFKSFLKWSINIKGHCSLTYIR